MNSLELEGVAKPQTWLRNEVFPGATQLPLPMKKCTKDSAVEHLDLLRHLQFVPSRLAGYKPCPSGSLRRGPARAAQGLPDLPGMA
jgi:hypothetical protein